MLLLDEVLDINRTNWEERTIGLDAFAFEWIDLCLSIEAAGSEPAADAEKARHYAFWTNPAIVRRGPVDTTAIDAPDALTPEEIDVQRQHLKALGYVD